MHKLLFPAFIAIGIAACGQAAVPAVDMDHDLNTIARDYLVLELSMIPHDASHVDAYFGPPELKREAEDLKLTLPIIDEQAAAMQEVLSAWPQVDSDALLDARIRSLQGRLQALRTRISMDEGMDLPFDEESQLLFNATAPHHDASYYQAILDRIDALLPGDGTTSERITAFRAAFEIPKDRLPVVFDAAIQECRKRTLEKIELPEHESFRTEFVTDKPWSGYNWYQGNSSSLIQVNTDLPIYIDRAVELGCHEGYPGHHTYNTLIEKNLVNDKGWLEFSLYPLFSPTSLIAEGSGNYGVHLAFPDDERNQFEKNVLFPLAGLDGRNADRYYELLELLAELNYAGNEAARDYLDGRISADEAIDWLVTYTLASPERARQRVAFFDNYRSYVINYNLGQDMVAEYVERGAADNAERWRRFGNMLSTPMLPGDLQQ